MDLKQWIIGQHLGMRITFERGVLNLVPKEQMVVRPNSTGNSIAWLMWHVARTEDVFVTTVARGEPQILQRDGWTERIGIDDYRIGTGLQDDEVDEFNKGVDVDGVDAYWQAVRTETLDWLQSSPIEVLDEVPDLAERLAKIPEIAPSIGPAVVQAWGGRPIGFHLSFVVISHGLIHVGEMQAIRGLLGYKGF